VSSRLLRRTYLPLHKCANIGLKVTCPVRLRLAIDHRDTTRVYSEAVRKMTELMGLGLESEVAGLRRACRTAWEATETARLGLARHEADHFCDRDGFVNSASASGSS
jgi:hypothetical protein